MFRALIVVALVTAAADAQPPPRASESNASLRVAAASDLKPALDEIVKRLAAARPSLTIQPTYGSSGSMHAQLRQRAPYDVFLSADVDYPRDLVSRGVGTEKDLFIYAVGHLVVWVPTSSTLALERDGLRGLSSARRVAIANPRVAPYGRAAEAALRSAGVWPAVSQRLVLGENVAQAAQFAQSGGADAAIVGRSTALAPVLRESGRAWRIPENAYPPIRQAGLITPWTAARDAAVQFRDYLLTGEGRQVLAAYGFDPPDR
jgi:molybdate transport system substrate-binding protein